MTSAAITPGSTATVSTNVTVSVDNAESYSLTLAVDNAKLTNGSTTIPAGNVVSDNTWGYKWDNASTYTTPSTSGTTLTNSTLVPLDSNGAVSFTKNLTFGAKFSTSAEAGHYKGSGTLSLVATPKKAVNPFGIEAMQEMTASICSNTKENDTAQLKDTRDNKYYWVAKLKDGNCWMTQNLDLDLSTSKTLTSADSDITSSWTPSYATVSTVTSSTILYQADGQRSWSLGDYRLTKPTEWNGCGTSKNSGADCPSQFTAYSTPISANEDINAHYILGNHYQWNAATAGTGSNISAAGQAANSICPKGWRLPTSTTSGEFQALINVGNIEKDVAKLTSSPYYFARSGMIYQSASDLWVGAGDRGLYWAATSSADGESYSLYFNRTNWIYPSHVGYISESYNSSGLFDPSPIYRAYGASVRCVAKTTGGAQTSSPK